MRLWKFGATAAWAIAVATVALAQQGPPAADPCALVTRADIEQIAGKLKGTPTAYVHERAKQCSFEFANGDEMEIWVFPETGLDRAKQSLKDLKPMTDLGIEALQRRNQDIGWFELYTRKNSVTLEVAMKGTGDADKVKLLARKALAGL